MEDRITSQIFIVIARIVTRSAADKTLKVHKNAPVYVTGCNGIVYSLPNETQFSTLVDLLHAVFLQVPEAIKGTPHCAPQCWNPHRRHLENARLSIASAAVASSLKSYRFCNKYSRIMASSE